MFTSLQTATALFQLCRYSSQKATNWTLKVVCEICNNYFYFNILNPLSSAKLYKHLNFLKNIHGAETAEVVYQVTGSLLKGLC